MPFTPAHVVAAVPLAPLFGRRAVVAALAIGAMTPDLAYFLPLDVPRWQSHTVSALLWFCLPVGLATWIVFETCIAPLVVDVAPQALRDRLPPRWASGAWPPDARSGAGIAAVATCIVVGACTHLVWDSFTHLGTPLLRAVPVLGQPFARPGGYPVRPVTLLQHGSTLLGFVVLAVWARRWWARPPRSAVAPPRPPGLRIALVVIVLAPATWAAIDVAFARLTWGHAPMLALQRVAHAAVITGGTAFTWSLVLAAVTWRLVRAWPSPRLAASEPVDPS